MTEQKFTPKTACAASVFGSSSQNCQLFRFTHRDRGKETVEI